MSKDPSIYEAQHGTGGGTTGLPSTGGINNPLAMTGLNQNQLSTGVLQNQFSGSNILPTDPVYVGVRGQGNAPGQGLGVAKQRDMTYQEAQTLPGRWAESDPNFYKQFLGKLIMYKYPGANANMGMPEALSAWDDLLKVATTLNKSGSKKQWTPWDILESYNRPAGSAGTHKSGDWLIDNATGEKVKYVGPKSRTTKQTQVNLSDPEQVQAIATQTLTQMIGRAPTDKELAQFKATLNGYEAKHPAVTSTTENYDDQGQVVSTSAVQSGGVDDAARATVLGEGLKKTKEYGKYQSGTTYFNALMQMIGGG